MIEGELNREQKILLASWLHYHNVICRRNRTEQEWRAKHSVVDGKTVLIRSSKYGPRDRFDIREAVRHRKWCLRNGWAPYTEYLKRIRAWYDKQQLTRSSGETPRQKAERILREKGLAPA